MEESKFQKEKADLQRILQEEIERIGAEGIEKENLSRVGVIAWITADVGDDESYTKDQLRELFGLVKQINITDLL